MTLHLACLKLITLSLFMKKQKTSGLPGAALIEVPTRETGGRREVSRQKVIDGECLVKSAGRGDN